jgi:SHS family lactate transporter-like MFS transporter
MLVNQFGFSQDELAITQSIANIGAIIGVITAGYASDYLGRRLTIIICCVIGSALLYPYTFTHSIKVIAPAFLMNMAVQGVYGVIPSHLLDLSPGTLRSFVIGTSYQLGNLASSGSTTIQARIGENYPLQPGPTGMLRFNYGLVICIFIGVSCFLVLLLAVLGPEKKGQSMEIATAEESTVKESAASV